MAFSEPFAGTDGMLVRKLIFYSIETMRPEAYFAEVAILFCGTRKLQGRVRIADRDAQGQGGRPVD
jgi:hypothetical protein